MTKLCLFKVWLTFPIETLIYQLLSFDELEAFLEESWSTLDQMIDINSKCLCWPKILKYDKVMPGQSLVDFSYRNPNLSFFYFWWVRSISWEIMINPWSNYGYHFKMLMFTKNLGVWLYVDLSWLLTWYSWFSITWLIDWATFCRKA